MVSLRSIIIGVVFICGCTFSIHGETVEPTEECRISKDKPLEDSSNQMDCNTEENLAAKTTQCCTVGTEIGCCPEQAAESGRMLKIAMAIVGVSLGLALIVFLLTWCDKKSFPCLQRCEDRCRPCCESCEENVICCHDRVEKRKYERQIEEHENRVNTREGGRGGYDDNSAGNVHLPLPPEMKEKVPEDWF